MKRKFAFIFSLFLGLVMTIIPGFFLFNTQAQENQEEIKLDEKQKIAYENLKRKASNLYLDWDDLDVIPDFIRMTNLNIDWQSSDYTERAYQFLEEYKDLYKMSDPRNELKFRKKSIDELGMTHVTLRQEYKGVPVYAELLKVHFRKDGSISSVNGTYLPNIPETYSQPIISSDQAFVIAKDELNIEVERGDIELFIYNHGLFSKKKENIYLTWRLSVYSRELALNQLFYINAQDGSIITQLNNLLDARNRETYVLEDCWDFLGTLTYNESGLVGDYDEEAFLAHSYAGSVYDYYYNNFFRDSYDNIGGTIESYTHYEEMTAFYPICSDYENASWDPDLRIIRYGENYTTADVAAHELTHGVTQYAVGDTASDTLEYENQSGALNESYSDIFAVMVDRDDWLIGEDLPSGAVRSLQNPTGYSQPDYMSSYIEGGEVHYNSGIPNNAAYLLSEGGSNSTSGISVTGIGREISEEIYYRTLTTYLNTDSDFEDAYEGTMISCLDLYESDSSSYPFSNCETVFDAFAAVGINIDNSFIEVNIEASPLDGYAPLTVSFDGSGSISVDSTITDYNWDFGDSTSGNGVTAIHEYTSPGSYSVTLTVIDSDGETASTIYQLEVFNPIQPYFTVSGDGTPAPATVTFDASATTDVSGMITDYSWSYGDGATESTGTTSTASHVYTSSSYYSVTLTVTDDNGYTNTYSQSVFIGTTSPTYVSGTVYNDTWQASRSPYVITGSISVPSGSTLTIEEGTVIKFQFSSESLSISGTLDAIGTSSQPIVFTSYHDDTYGGDTNGDGSTSTPEPEDWQYIYFASTSMANIDHAIIRYGGYTTPTGSIMYPMLQIYSDDVIISNSTISDSTYHNIYIEDASPTLSGDTISDAESYGIYVDGGSSIIQNNTISGNNQGVYVVGGGTPVINNNNFDSNDGASILLYNGYSDVTITDNNLINSSYPIYFYNSWADNISGNTSSGNSYEAIFVSGSVNADIVAQDYSDINFSYLISGSFVVPSGYSLTITSGAVIKLLDSYSYLMVPGTLNVQGAESNPAVFTSYRDDTYGGDSNGDGSATTPAPEDWGYLYFSSGSTVNIDHAIIRYGGYTTPTGSIMYPMLQIYSDDVIISNSTISDSTYHNIYIEDASPILTGNTILGANQHGVYIQSGSPMINQNNIYNNDSYGVVNVDSSSTVNAENNWWGDASGPYNAASNPSGTGDEVSNYVDFEPWLTASITSPTANAGVDQTVEEKMMVTLDGSSSTDPTGLGLTYYWEQTAGTTVTLSDVSATSTSFTAPDLTADETLSFELTVTNTYGETNSDTVDIFVQADLTPPAEVSSLRLIPDVWQRRITLRWTNPTDSDFTGVMIDRSDGTTTTTLVSGFTGVNYTDTGLSYGRAYTYTIYTLDDDSNQSSGVSATRILRNPMPTNFALIAGNQQITASWTASSAPASQVGGYRLYYRRGTSDSFTSIDVGNVMGYTLTSLTNGVSYQLYATAYSTTGIESPRTPIRVATPHL